MEVYILNEALQREVVVDRFESLVWAERYYKPGDFELTLQSTATYRNLFPLDTKLIVNNSTRVMMVDTVEDTVSDDGETLLKVSGRSIEAVLEGKTTFNAALPPMVPQSWKINGHPHEIIYEIMEYSSGLYGKSFFQTGSFYPADTIPYPDSNTSVVVPVTSLYKVILEIAEVYGLGIRLVRNPENAKIYFNVYTGIDRSSAQSTSTPVIFDPQLNNILNSSYLQSRRGSTKFAHVTNSVTGAQLVYGDDVDWTTASANWFTWQGSVVDTESMNLNPSDPGYWPTLTTLGLEEIAKHRQVDILDGDVPSNAYTYGSDYNLGDIVDMRNKEGFTNRVRIIEQILSDGPEGEKSYPTFELVQFITPGSWSDWTSNEDWADASGVWEDR